MSHLVGWPPIKYDYLIVGAGSAGCVLAHRLSVTGARVLLLTSVGAGGLRFIAFMTPGGALQVTWRAKRPDFIQARIMGGGSSLMGMIALRGLPEDYDTWEPDGVTDGAQGWAWRDVTPFVRAVESDRDYGGALHGADGRMCIRRHLPADWPPFSQEIARALRDREYPYVGDLNAEFSDGYGPLPMSSTLSSWVTSAAAYMDPQTRARSNLTVQCDTLVERLEFRGNVLDL